MVYTGVVWRDCFLPDLVEQPSDLIDPYFIYADTFSISLFFKLASFQKRRPV